MKYLKILINKLLSLLGYSIKKNKKISTLEYLLLAQNYYLSRKILKSEKHEFIDYIKKNSSRSNSSLYQDLFALWVNKDIIDGYFVEFGAGNGKDYSNSWSLEKIGWNGLLIEPSSNFKECKINRSVKSINYAVTSVSGQKIKFYETNDKNFSSIHLKSKSTEKIVSTIKLSDALQLTNAPKIINFLSVDVEGGEFDALLGMDFNSYYVKCLVVEHNFDKDNRSKIYDLLIKNQFRLIFKNKTLYEDWYVNDK
jgi:FkbM family methyltransferase